MLCLPISKCKPASCNKNLAQPRLYTFNELVRKVINVLMNLNIPGFAALHMREQAGVDAADATRAARSRQAPCVQERVCRCDERDAGRRCHTACLWAASAGVDAAIALLSVDGRALHPPRLREQPPSPRAAASEAQPRALPPPPPAAPPLFLLALQVSCLMPSLFHNDIAMPDLPTCSPCPSPVIKKSAKFSLLSVSERLAGPLHSTAGCSTSSEGLPKRSRSESFGQIVVVSPAKDGRRRQARGRRGRAAAAVDKPATSRRCCR